MWKGIDTPRSRERRVHLMPVGAAGATAAARPERDAEPDVLLGGVVQSVLRLDERVLQRTSDAQRISDDDSGCDGGHERCEKTDGGKLILTAGAPAASVTDTVTWRQVSATGHYDAAGQVLVRKRPFEGANGFWVATPLVTDSGAVLVVNRGWIAASGGATAVQEVPAPPAVRAR